MQFPVAVCWTIVVGPHSSDAASLRPPSSASRLTLTAPGVITRGLSRPLVSLFASSLADSVLARSTKALRM